MFENGMRTSWAIIHIAVSQKKLVSSDATCIILVTMLPVIVEQYDRSTEVENVV
jgi:hypothetical protein